MVDNAEKRIGSIVSVCEVKDVFRCGFFWNLWQIGF
jgi:hypothetical protein